ncbi:SDR family oxidoreductase [Halonotius terrestris]|jgi:putative NADH-flavin reductase|uniref:SDR family oxidoreductase n=1 Tax=Halonotius terrestris TaxID=2487750 RepID=A0A8J8PA83_9EURY|nr:SDR family oxidoreductase [Halonotius terrestris]MEA1932472.1 SDR family oxidoreductase [Euryarchaeota archaeon]TQQ78375.1 SDR family oxidoreductase [Halonotius terrestris]
MKLAVFGATGGTGRRLITQALAADYDVQALTRSQAKLPPGEQITAIEGNVLDPKAVSETVEHTDAVVCLLGRTPNNPLNVVSRGTQNIIAAMDDRPVSRLLVLTSMGLGSSSETVPWYVRIANATILHDLMADKARPEELVMQSDLDWTIIRPGGLTDAPRTGEYVHGIDIDVHARPISRSDIADFLLQIVKEDLYVREIPIVTSQEKADLGFYLDQFTTIAKRLGTN